MAIWLAVLMVLGGVAPVLAQSVSCEDDRAATRALVGVVAQSREQAEIRLAQALARIRALEDEIRRLTADKGSK